MKKLIWKITYKIIERWMKVAKRNRLNEQELDCIHILVDLEMYKGHMQEKGLWQEGKNMHDINGCAMSYREIRKLLIKWEQMSPKQYGIMLQEKKRRKK